MIGKTEPSDAQEVQETVSISNTQFLADFFNTTNTFQAYVDGAAIPANLAALAVEWTIATLFGSFLVVVYPVSLHSCFEEKFAKGKCQNSTLTAKKNYSIAVLNV